MNEHTDAQESPVLQKLIEDLQAAQRTWSDHMRQNGDDFDPDCPIWDACEKAHRALLAYPCRLASEVRMKVRFYLWNDDSREFMSERDEIKVFLRSLVMVERS